MVNYKLTGQNDLLIGATADAAGRVHLANTSNDFSGAIRLNASGVSLTFAEGALGNATIDVGYGNSAVLQSSAFVERVTQDSTGMVLVDSYLDSSIDLSAAPGIALGASSDTTWSSEMVLADNQAYRLGAVNGATLTVATTLAAGHDLVVDAQGFTGGEVVLAADSGITGQVSIMGHKDGTGGGITLGFAADNALESASGIAVQNGGVLDVGSTTQTLTNAEVQAGGLVKGNADGTAIFRMTEDCAMDGTLQLGKVEKIGSANLVLNTNNNSWSSFTIREGTVTLGSVNFGNHFALAGGALATAGTVNYNGTISVAVGDSGTLSGGAWKLNGAENIVNNGALNLENTKLYFNSTSAQTLRGTLNVLGNSELHSIESDGGDNMQKYLGSINVDSGNTLKFIDHTWNTIWNIDALSGDGEVVWDSTTTHSQSARIIIGGDGQFVGSIDVNRDCSNAWGTPRTYQVYLQVNSAEAISGATVNLNGTERENSSRATLALNAEKIKVGGLNGTAYSHVIAGAAPGDSGSTTAPSSTRNATLVLTDSGEYTYRGTIGAESDKTSGYAVSIEMAGTGTQTINGSTVVLGNVSALDGMLNITSSNLHVVGDVSVAQGAVLKLNDSFTLGAGQTLHVLAADAGQSAVLNNNLELGGGALHFEAYGSSAATAALSTAGVSSTGGTTSVSFGNVGGIQQLEVAQWLVSGDWSALDGKLSVDMERTPEYLNATLSASSTGLTVIFTLNDGFTNWTGDEGVLTSDAKVVFAGIGGVDSANLTSDRSIDTGYFVSDETFSVSGGALSMLRLEKSGAGELVLNSAVSADTLAVKEAATITGSGSLQVGTLSLGADLTTGMVVTLESLAATQPVTWTLDGSEHAFTQRLTVAQANSLSGLAVQGSATLVLDSASAATLSAAISGSTFDKVGAGKLTIAEGTAFRIETLNLNEGSFEAQGAVDIGTLNVADGLTATMWNATAAAGAEKKLGTVVLGNGSTLETNNRANVSTFTTIGKLELSGSSATVLDVENSGAYAIHNIIGDADSTLNLVKNTTSNVVTLFALGSQTETTEAGSQFAGTILLKQQNASSDWYQDMALQLNHATVAQKATVNLHSAEQSTPWVSLGVNVETSTIAGLESGSALGDRAVLYSGAQTPGVDLKEPGDNAPVNTLVINTAVGITHDFYGQVRNVNLVIDGEGTQNFLGSSDKFRGSIAIEGGTAGFNQASKGMLDKATSVYIGNGTLDLSLLDLSNSADSINIGADQSFTLSENATLAFGNLEAGTVYQVFNIASGYEVAGWGELRADQIIIGGINLADMARATYTQTMTGGFSYSLNSLELTWNGGSEGPWNCDDENSPWTHIPTGVTEAESIAFAAADKVIFNGTIDTTLTLTEDIIATSITIKDNKNHTFTGGKDLTVQQLVSEGTGTMSLGNTEASRTVTVNESSDIDGTLDVYWGTTLNLKGLTHNIGTLITRAKTVENNKSLPSSVIFAAQAATIGSVEMRNDSTITFGLAEGANAATYTVDGAITINTNSTTARSIVVNQGVSLIAGSLTNTHGLGSLQVDGSMTVNGALSYKNASGDNPPEISNEQTIKGSGSLTVGSAEFNHKKGNYDLAINSLTVNGNTTGNGVVRVTDGSVNFKGNATLADLCISGGSVYVSGSTLGIQGGAVTLEGGALHLNREGNQTVAGDLNVLGNSELHGVSGWGADNMQKAIGHINVADGNSLKLRTYTWNTIWNVEELSGSGSITWNSTTNHGKTDRMVLSGDGGFAGELNVTAESPSAYMAFLQVNSEHAISGATVNLADAAYELAPDKALTSVGFALNADRVRIGGLKGSGKSHVFAGSAPETRSDAAASSTRNSTLVFTGSGDYTYSGSIGHVNDTTSSAVSIEMAGTGTQTINGSSVVLNDISVNSGALNINSSGLKVLDDVTVNGGSLAINGSFDVAGDEQLVTLAAGARMQQTGDMWLKCMKLAEGASFTKDEVAVIGLSGESSMVQIHSDSSIVNYFDGSHSQNHEIQHARVQVNSADNRDLKTKLTDSVVENAGSGVLTVSNYGNTLSGVAAYGGDVHLENLKDATSLNLLEIAAGRTVMAYVDSNTETCSSVTVTEAARLSGGAMLKAASLTLADGATLDMVNLGETGMDLCGGALTFGCGVTMGEELLASVGALDYAESLVLFTGLSGVSLPAVVATESDRVLASSIFSNVQSETLYVTYQTVDNVGSLLVVNVPEPATSTLGLLALTALAARRRRK